MGSAQLKTCTKVNTNTCRKVFHVIDWTKVKIICPETEYLECIGISFFVMCVWTFQKSFYSELSNIDLYWGTFPTIFYSEVQANLCQKLTFLHQLIHNMTTDCLLNYKFNTWTFQAQTWGEHVVYRNGFCTQHVLPMFCKKKSIWQRFTLYLLYLPISNY